MQPGSAAASRIAFVLLLLFLLVAGVHAATSSVVGSDLWWAMATGRYITEHHEVPHTDLFSYTQAGAPWFNQEWLTQLLYFNVFRALGGNGVAALKLLIATSLFLLAGWIGVRRSGSRLLGVIAAVAAAFVCRPYIDIRPQLSTFLGTLVLIAVVDAYRRGARPAILAIVPVVMLLWVNLHFGFIFGLGVLVLFALCEIAKAFTGLPDAQLPRRRALLLGAAAGAGAVVCVLNPQHLHAFTFPFSIVGSNNPWREILEWKPPVLFQEGPFNPALFGYFFVLQAAALLAALVLAPRRFDVTHTSLVVVTAFMALTSRRFVPLFALVSAPFLATNVAVVAGRLFGRAGADSKPVAHRGVWATAAVALGGLVAVSVLAVSHGRQTFASGFFDGMIHTRFFPRDGVEFLRSNPIPGRLFNFYNWGGYLMYWMPERKVFIDGRAHTVYPGSMFIEYADVYAGKPNRLSILDRFGVDLVLVPAEKEIALGFRLTAGWTRVYDDSTAAIFLREREATEPWLDRFRKNELVTPETPAAQIWLAEAFMERREYDRSLALLDEVRRRWPDEWKTIVQRKRDIEVYLARATKEAGALFRVGFWMEALGDARGALEAYRLSLEKGGDYSWAREAPQRLRDSH